MELNNWLDIDLCASHFTRFAVHERSDHHRDYLPPPQADSILQGIHMHSTAHQRLHCKRLLHAFLLSRLIRANAHVRIFHRRGGLRLKVLSYANTQM